MVGEGDDQLWGSGRGAIAGCHCVGEGEGDGQLWGSGRGAIAGCHCTMVGEGEGDGEVGGVDVVPLQGAIVVCYGGGRGG